LETDFEKSNDFDILKEELKWWKTKY
jgi:hypothetical protein